MLDCRNLCFSKWILPKINSLYTQDASGLTIGYFDFVTVEEIDIVDDHSFNAYVRNKNNNERINSKKNLELTKQDFFMFTNIDDNPDVNIACYDMKKIKDFWNDASFLRFYSFLHISEGASKESVLNIVKKINTVFGQSLSDEDYKVVCYFSLDYSDMIICSRCESILEYSKAIFSLNYNQESKLVKDSFSLISIDKGIMNKISKLIPNSNCQFDYTTLRNDILSKFSEIKCFNDGLNIYLNLGIQNYNVFRKLEKDLIDHRIDYTKYKILGRHDITINKNNADLIWLIVIQKIIDFYSIYNEEQKLSYENVIFNCETYIRLPFENDENYYDEEYTEDSKSSEKYNSANKKLCRYVKKYCGKQKLKDEHKTPVYALYYSVMGLLKNGFAEDFVICVYNSFIFFLKYMIKKIEKGEYENLEFDKCFNSYFDNINALTGSAMHSERQFIQSPSFNPVFYDLPPKLMAFYTAVTNMVSEIMNTHDKGIYSFMFRPSFSRDIKVSSFSYSSDVPPTDRLLEVTINENDFYNPFEVACQMCHEVAHYVGDKNRNRKLRKEIFLKCILFNIIIAFLDSANIEYSEETYITIYVKKIVNLLKKEFYYKNDSGYSYKFEDLLYLSLNLMADDAKYNDIIKKFFSKCSKNSDALFVSDISVQFNDYLVGLGSLLLRNSTDVYDLHNNVNLLKSILSETYADIQMILILNLNLTDYLSTFRKLDFENIEHILIQRETYSRILNVVMFFTFKGKWELLNDEKNRFNNLCKMLYKDIYDVVNYCNDIETLKKELYGNTTFNHNVFEDFSSQNSCWKRYLYWSINIQKYISEVYKSSTKTYNINEKRVLINKLNNSLLSIKDFDDAIGIFTNIQSLNDNYANSIYECNTNYDAEC